MSGGVVLVLGAGGASGWIFHLGVLAGLTSETGWEPDQADLMIGTSAGSVVAAGLRAGMTVEEIYEAVDRPPSEEDRQIVMSEVQSNKRSFRPLSPGLARRRNGGGIGAIVSGLLPPGQFPTWPLTGRGAVKFPTSWDRLWIPALDTTTGSRHIFGRDQADVDVADAVEASCALPGLFQPKDIDGVRYTDGGAISPTNADLAADVAPDLVVISSPMSRPSRRPLAQLARSRLGAEVASLRDTRTPTIVVEPREPVDRLFKAYPRRNREAGTVIEAQGRRLAQEALAVHPTAASILAFSSA